MTCLAACAQARADFAKTPAETYRELEQDGTRGGELDFVVSGTVEQVLDLLLRFDDAEGHRAWARTYETLERTEDRVLARWNFAGKLGVNPSVVLELTTSRAEETARIDYRVKEKAFGLRSFFGDYTLEGLAQDPPMTRVTERVFIDSGLPFVNASSEDIETGLRKDARLLQEWTLSD